MVTRLSTMDGAQPSWGHSQRRPRREGTDVAPPDPLKHIKQNCSVISKYPAAHATATRALLPQKAQVAAQTGVKGQALSLWLHTVQGPKFMLNNFFAIRMGICNRYKSPPSPKSPSSSSDRGEGASSVTLVAHRAGLQNSS